jgi:hypothetical protein
MHDEHENAVYYQDGLPFQDVPDDDREDDEVFLSYLLGEEQE